MSMSIIFCGTGQFAVPSLYALRNDPAFTITLVITQPDKPVGRHRHVVSPPPVKIAAEALDIAIRQPTNINTEQLDSADVLVVVAYGQILRKPLLQSPHIAAINVHASLLPRWRGASPIEHALLAGDEWTGVTVQQMEEKLDTGPILGQRKVTIGPREKAPALRERLATLGAELLRETLHHPLRPIEQDEHLATVCRKLKRADGKVNPTTMTATEIDRRIRALEPWPGVTCHIGKYVVKLLDSELVATGNCFPLPCAEGTTLFLTRMQPPGKKAMSAEEWRRGYSHGRNQEKEENK